MKNCLVCNFKKTIKKDDDLLKKNISTHIHEHNFSCYECLDNMQKEKEKKLREIYDKMKIIGFIDE